MKRSSRSVLKESVRRDDRRCNHPLAVLVDPTELELRQLERMLAECPNCSRWMPGDGPIMAILLTRESTRQEPKDMP